MHSTQIDKHEVHDRPESGSRRQHVEGDRSCEKPFTHEAPHNVPGSAVTCERSEWVIRLHPVVSQLLKNSMILPVQALYHKSSHKIFPIDFHQDLLPKPYPEAHNSSCDLSLQIK